MQPGRTQASARTLVCIAAIGEKEANELLLSAGFYPATDNSKSGIKQFNADMKKYSPKTERLDATISGWAAVKTVADALNKSPSVDSAALYQTLQTYEYTLQASPDVDLGNGGNAYNIPRVFTTLTALQKYKNGKYYTDVDFFDPLVAPDTSTKKK